jgi:purine-nucleoside/S-methyl-5'-thioadenosine phosphorylase / adenosine deaminase
MKSDASQVGISIAIPALDRLGIIQYAFTTRQNGLGARSQGTKQPDDWKPVAEALGISPERLVTVNQVHGETIVRVEEANYKGTRSAEADAMITRVRGLAVGVETADCVPILLVDPATPAVAAVHAGWRSTVKNIVQKTVAKLQKEFGSDPGRMIAAIGPAIGPECYEVDEPVMGPLRGNFSFWREVASPRGNGRWSLDLVKLNRRELVRAGLPETNVYSFGLCTCCRADLFYSFRREGRTGRMLSVVMIKP